MTGRPALAWPRLTQWLWFVALWALGVTATGVVGLAIRAWLK